MAGPRTPSAPPHGVERGHTPLTAPPAVQPRPPLPAASLIICSRNRPQFLQHVVASVLAGDDVPAEIVVIDQSDTPNASLQTVAGSPESGMRYLWSRGKGLCRANNAGVAAARHDLLVFTHDDILVTAAWFGTLVRALIAAGPDAVVTGRVLPSTPETPGGFAPSTQVEDAPRVVHGRSSVEILHPMNLALHREAVARAGGFDERIGPGTSYPAGEGHDLEFRLREAGYRIVHAPDAVVYHRAWREAGDYLPVRWHYGRGQGAYYAKHLHRRDRWMLRRLGWDVRHRGRQFFEQLPDDPRCAFGELFFLGGTLAGMVAWLLTPGGRAQGVRKVPAADAPRPPWRQLQGPIWRQFQRQTQQFQRQTQQFQRQFQRRVRRQTLSAAPASDAVPEPIAGPLPVASLVICSRDRGRRLEETVRSILAGDEVPSELIIVDQSIAPNAVLKALTMERGCAVRYLESETRGESPARNAGIAAARHDLVVFADDDVRVAPDWYGLMVRTLAAAGPRSVVTCRILPDPKEKTGGFVPVVRKSAAPAVYRGRTLGQPLCTVALATYRAAFDQVGLFDERLGAGGRFPSGEDADLGYRLLEAGYQVVYQPRAMVYHRAWRPNADYLGVRWALGVGHGAFCSKYFSLRDPYVMQRLRYELGQKALHFLPRLASEPPRALGDLVEITGTFYGMAKWLVTEGIAPRKTEPSRPSPVPAREPRVPGGPRVAA